MQLRIAHTLAREFFRERPFMGQGGASALGQVGHGYMRVGGDTLQASTRCCAWAAAAVLPRASLA